MFSLVTCLSSIYPFSMPLLLVAQIKSETLKQKYNSIPLMKYEGNVTCINRNSRTNNNQLITYYLSVRYLLRIQQYPLYTLTNPILV